MGIVSLIKTFVEWSKIKTVTGTQRSPSRLKHDMSNFQFDGFAAGKNEARFVDILPDTYLQELNSILDWNCFTVDQKGRRFGKPTGPTKRINPQPIPDYRTPELHKRFNLSDKTVLEVGCFEGVHTIGLCQFAKHVKAVDSRIENIVKTMVRTSFYDCHPQCFRVDLESLTETEMTLMSADVIHHVGVLYHLSNPVAHLQKMASYINYGIMLDTHYAKPEMLNSEYDVDGVTYKYFRYKESGYQDVFSGMKDHAKWLQLSDLESILKNAGYKNIEILENRDERNGPRVLMFASK
jgi:tRNA (mo5U34)-methyltransferase